MEVIKPPTGIARAKRPRLFLAGSIEMGKAQDWQSVVEEAFKDINGTIYNPRRDNWDASWEQDINNDGFYEQVRWELQALEDSDLIVMHLESNTISPISLLELGLFAKSGKLIVSCPKGFHRKGNVDIVCDTYRVSTVDSLEELISRAKDEHGLFDTKVQHGRPRWP